MKKQTTTRFLGFSGLVLLTSFAFAEGVQTQDFDTLDKNQDGVLSAAEASSNTNLSTHWTNVDKDGSGSIDKAEFSAFETEEMPEESHDKSMHDAEKEESKY